MATEELPTRVNVMRVFTYDVAQIVQDLRDDNRDSAGEMEITHDDVMERIEQLAEADFAYYDVSGLIYQDQDGNDL
jgi:hypothetical protein